MCLICVEYNKLSFNDLIRNVNELTNTNPKHAEEFFYKLEKENPDLLSEIERHFWDNLSFGD